MATTVRHCIGTITDVYEILGETQVEVYEAALRVVKDQYTKDVTFDIHTIIQDELAGFLVMGQLNVYG